MLYIRVIRKIITLCKSIFLRPEMHNFVRFTHYMHPEMHKFIFLQGKLVKSLRGSAEVFTHLSFVKFRPFSHATLRSAAPSVKARVFAPQGSQHKVAACSKKVSKSGSSRKTDDGPLKGVTTASTKDSKWKASKLLCP